MLTFRVWRGTLALVLLAGAGAAQGQPPDFGPPPGFPPGGRGPGGFGGFPGMQRREIVKDYDKDGDGRLNQEERKAARVELAKQPRRGPRPGGFGGPAENQEIQPGIKLTAKDVKLYGSEPLYDPKVVRTLFLEFEAADWEKELADFNNTDVEVPAKLSVDGKEYPGVGVHFRGMSSFMMVPEGRKRSLNLSLDFTDKKQRLGGYRTLNLLNSHMDPTYLRSILYLQINREYIPAPKANYVRVVINGENWGIYISAQQFNTDFTKEWFQTTKGARWKTPGSPMGRAGLNYIGTDPAAYKKLYEIKSKDDAKSWAALINLCKTLSETPIEKLEQAVEPILDVDGTLRFLALEKALINSDGYWVRASDFNLYLDEKGKFHLIPHDSNETLRPPEMMPRFELRRGFGPGGPPPEGFGPGGPPPGGPPPGGPGGSASREATLDPFEGAKDEGKPLISRLLAVPSLRERYLKYMREIATKWLDWNRIGPLAREYQALIAADIARDTRKIDSTETFTKSVTEETMSSGPRPSMPGRNQMSLKEFVEKRRAFLLGYPEIAKLGSK